MDLGAARQLLSPKIQRIFFARRCFSSSLSVPRFSVLDKYFIAPLSLVVLSFSASFLRGGSPLSLRIGRCFPSSTREACTDSRGFPRLPSFFPSFFSLSVPPQPCYVRCFPALLLDSFFFFFATRRFWRFYLVPSRSFEFLFVLVFFARSRIAVVRLIAVVEGVLRGKGLRASSNRSFCRVGPACSRYTQRAS